MFEVSAEETFSAGHALRGYRGKCENVHGHNYRVRVTLAGEQLNANGLLVDFVEIKRAMRVVIEKLDHRLLNDVAPFDAINPSAENMAQYLYDEVARELAAAPARVIEVKLWETETATATYRP